MKLLIIYLIFLCWYNYAWYKNKVNLLVYNNGQILMQLFLIINFFFFVLGIKILDLFRENKLLKINNLILNPDCATLILYVILIFSLRKLMLYVFKVSWFKFNYVMMSQNNFSFSKKYNEVYYSYLYAPACFSYKYFFYINYFVMFGLLLCFLYDIVFNNLILNYSLVYLKYYSLFRLMYMGRSFIALKQSVLLDFYSYNLLYPGVIETSLFCNFKDPEHLMLIEESKLYVNGIILEKIKYEPKTFGDTRKMAFFVEIEK